MPSREESGTAPLVVAFHTPVWNEEVARLARRLRHFTLPAAFTVLADETNGIIPTENFTKLSHGADFSALGLPSFPAPEGARYTADVPLYLLRQTYPQASHFAVVENDVAVNADIMPMLKQAQAEAVDLIAHDIRVATPSWHWHGTVKKHYGEPLRACTSFMVVSARAIDMMYAERLRMAAALAAAGAGTLEDWPVAEAFIPSATALLADGALRELSDFARLPVFGPRPVQHADDPAMIVPGTICHPVAGGDMFIKRRVATAGFDDLFDPRSNLLTQLCFCDPAKFARILHENVKKDRDIVRLKMFAALAEAKNWPVTQRFDNLALFRPALMSSAWHGGDAPDLAALAGGGNNGIINGSFGFHTAFEPAPWWQVDLQTPATITQIVVFNRLDQAARCRRLRVSGSLDGVSWETLVEKNDDVMFGGADGRPLMFQMRAQPVARFVRLTNLEQTYLHLDEVQIIGKAVA